MALGKHRQDLILLIATISTVLFGIVMIYSASVIVGYTDFNDPKYFFKRQLIWAVVGIIALITTSNIDYRSWKKWATALMITTILLLLSVFLFTKGSVNGAHRWITFLGQTFQPSELAKFSFLVYICAWFTKMQDQVKSFRATFFPFLGMLAVISILMLMEPDFGTLSIMLASVIAVFVVAGMSFQQFVVGLGTSVVAMGGILAVPYRRARILTFLDPSGGSDAVKYHIQNISIAIGSGGWFGVGYGASSQKRLFLPEPHTDSIFAIIIEELGLVVGIAIVAVFSLIIYRGYRIAAQTQDPFGRLLAVGITTWIGFQAFINLASMLGIVPLVGVPLPFISYGGTNLMISLAAMGVLLNISRYTGDKDAIVVPQQKRRRGAQHAQK